MTISIYMSYKFLEVVLVWLLLKLGFQEPIASIQSTKNALFVIIQTLDTIVSDDFIYFIVFTLSLAIVISLFKYLIKYTKEMKLMKEQQAFSFKKSKVKEWGKFLVLVHKSMSDKDFEKVSIELKLTNTIYELQNKKGKVRIWHIIYALIKSYDVRHIMWCSMLFIAISFCLKQVNYIFVTVANYALLKLGLDFPLLSEVLSMGIYLLIGLSVVLAILKSSQTGKLITLLLNLKRFKK